MAQETSLERLGLEFDRLSVESAWVDEFRDLLSRRHSSRPSSPPDIVFRAASPSSSGVNLRTEIKAGKYKNDSMVQIPSFDQIGRPGSKYYEPRDRVEWETRAHLDKYRRDPTGWISTTSSLLRALQILLLDHRRGGLLFVIRTAACGDVFAAPDLRDCLPGLMHDTALRSKSPNEFCVRGKIEERAIVGCASVEELLDAGLDDIVPGIGGWRGWVPKWDDRISSRFPVPRAVTDALLDVAVNLSFAFRMPDQEYMVRQFLSPSFGVQTLSVDDGVRVSVKIAQHIVHWLLEGLERLRRSIEDHT